MRGCVREAPSWAFFAAHHRRSSTFFPLRADTSPTDAAAAPTVAGAAAAAKLEREIYMDELAQSQEDIARLQREAETAEKAREAAFVLLILIFRKARGLTKARSKASTHKWFLPFMCQIGGV